MLGQKHMFAHVICASAYWIGFGDKNGNIYIYINIRLNWFDNLFKLKSIKMTKANNLVYKSCHLLSIKHDCNFNRI